MTCSFVKPYYDSHGYHGTVVLAAIGVVLKNLIILFEELSKITSSRIMTCYLIETETRSEDLNIILYNLFSLLCKTYSCNAFASLESIKSVIIKIIILTLSTFHEWHTYTFSSISSYKKCVYMVNTEIAYNVY